VIQRRTLASVGVQELKRSGIKAPGLL